MEWFALLTRRMRSPDYLRISPELRGHHHALIALLAERERGAVLHGAREWSRRDWDRACALTPASLLKLETAGLIRWDGNDLAVADYDEGGESRVRKARESGRKGGISKWTGHSDPIGDPTGKPTAVAIGTANGEPHGIATTQYDHRYGTKESECEAGPHAPSQPVLISIPRKPDPSKAELAGWLEWFNRKFARQFTPTLDLERLVRALVGRGWRDQFDFRGVTLYLRDEWLEDPKMAKFFRPGSILVASKFGERLDLAKERYPELWEPKEESHG